MNFHSFGFSGVEPQLVSRNRFLIYLLFLLRVVSVVFHLFPLFYLFHRFCWFLGLACKVLYHASKVYLHCQCRGTGLQVAHAGALGYRSLLVVSVRAVCLCKGSDL